MSREFDQHDVEKSKEQLLQEVVSLRQQAAELRGQAVELRGQAVELRGQVAELETAQSQQQRRLQLNRQRLNLVLRTSDIGIWFCDLPALNLEWDAKCKEHFGLPLHASVTVKRLLKRLHPNDRKGVGRALQRAVREGSIYDVTCRLQIDPQPGMNQPSANQSSANQSSANQSSANQQVRWIRAIGSVFYDVTGQPSRFDGITVNVTQQKLQEEERDSLLYREQLAREIAEAANRVKDEFLGVLSHELRSPLNPILGWSRLLQKRTFDPEIAQRALQTIERNAKLQTQLIEDLLDISRILRGKLTLNICAVDLAEVIAAALKTVHLAAEAKSIKIHTQFDPTIGKVAGDPVRLQQIIWNLLSNAIKFTAAEGWVEVKLEKQAEGRGQRAEGRGQETENQGFESAQITISDTGRGISADFLLYVFDYFRQANASTTRKFGGLGLGLAIARHLVELHGGTVQVFSAGEGQGATFTVFLPLVKDQQAGTAVDDEGLTTHPPFPDEQHPASLAKAATSYIPHSSNSHPSSLPAERFANIPHPLHGVRVLIVDHQRDTREVALFTLRQFGAETTIARSTPEALQTIATHPFDILLIELGTSRENGYQLMQQIRMLSPEQGGQIPSIALTSYPGEYNQQRVLQAGFQLHLSKSVEPEVLIAAIARLVKNSPLGQRGSG